MVAKITLAKSAGFCFGVNRAVNMVYKLIDEKKHVCTLGPIIHNTEMVNELKAKGVSIVSSPWEVTTNSTVVIRSHGVPYSTYEEIKSLNLQCTDATCPFVAKIHKTVAKASENNHIVLIVGDKNHPEVMGIQGHCSGEFYVVKNHDELLQLSQELPLLTKKPIYFVAQTTFDVSEWKKCLEIVKKVYTNAVIFDTICSATSERQDEAKVLAEKSDLMVVIGDRSSSNTCKLFDICNRVCDKTFLIENSSDLPKNVIKNACNIGVTAGASAPARIIKEVLDKMTDILNNSSETTDNECNFAEMLEENLKSFNTDGRVMGVVERITPNEIFVDVGRKQAGVVKLSELTNDPNATTEDLVKVGDTLDLLIMRTNDQEGMITLSKKRVDALKGWDEIVKAEEENAVLTGVVTEVIKGGVIVVSNGVRVFIPASQATASRGDALEDLLKKEVNFRIIDINKGRRRAVGSIRSVLKEQRDKIKEEFWKTCEIGKVYTGVVKSLTSYGAFVDIGGVDGMIHISELSWNRIKHPSEVVNVGDTVEVYVKDIDNEKGNISLGYKKQDENPWEVMKNDYPVGTVVDAQIVGMTSFGAFARIIPGIDGLIHISQIADRRIEKPQDELSVGQMVQAKITAIDFDKKRVSLSIRELLNDKEADEASDFEDSAKATDAE
ncbi:MAG TPA: bifunctional 4-hydroxy-3-methylbut-2-enyl diphosphate reductase/30S ribosomal protein S1 [Clostridiales bacterium]|nr:bifunctional 4-hydroxy-3-methylbut-2-enyl diphosphate reductase/30S ribosomal protein S1 [Clostridiales bacterium]